MNWLVVTFDLPGHRFEDVPGVRRHLVRKSTKGQVVHMGKDHKEPTTRSRKQDRTPHEVRPSTGGMGQDEGEESWLWSLIGVRITTFRKAAKQSSDLLCIVHLERFPSLYFKIFLSFRGINDAFNFQFFVYRELPVKYFVIEGLLMIDQFL